MIEGGTEVSPANSIPWHVYIAPMGREKACGGTLISYQHVLTAAHCTQIWFDNRFQREFDVRVGDPKNPAEYAWVCASKLAKSANFAKKCITRDQWMEAGSRATEQAFNQI